MGGGFIPANDNAEELTERCHKGEVIAFQEITARDLKMHRCYFSLLNMIYGYMPASFKKIISNDDFYKFLKHLHGDYDVKFTFKDGTKMVEYNSISFGKMSDKRFKKFIAEQLPFIYSEVIGAYYEGEIYDNIIQTIENDYQVFMNKLLS